MSTNQAGVLADLDAQMTALIGAPYTHLRADIKDKLLTAIAYAIAQWSPSSSGATAEALGTTGADVNVGAAAPPSTGQVLTATDATHATWQTPTAGASDGDKGDITVTGSGATWTIDAGVVTLAKMADIATDRLIGRDTAGTGVPEALTVGGGLEFTGAGGIQRSALTGDATASAGSATVTIANFTGDTGAGGVHGFVPAPAAGDAAAAKVLHADGTWATPVTAGRTYYLDPANASDIAGYYTALVAPSPGVETTLTVGATGTTDNLLASFATEPGTPGALLVPPGSAGRHFHVATGASNQIGRLLVRVYTCLADGTSETLIRSGYSPEFFGTTSQELLFSFTDATGYTITATQRLVYKVYAARVSGPATCNITVYFNGTDRASYVTSTILTPVESQPLDAGLTSLASADSAAGLAYPSAANVWTNLPLASADLGIYTSSAGVLASYSLTASGRALGGITLASTSVVVGTGAGTAGVKAATRGAVLYGAAGPVWDVLALGSSGQFLQSNGTDLIFGSIGGGALGSILTTRGDTLVRDATTVTRLPLGASGYYYRSDGADSLWAALAAADLTGTVAATQGGTGYASYAAGDHLYADTTTTLAKVAAPASGQRVGKVWGWVNDTTPGWVAALSFFGLTVAQYSTVYGMDSANYGIATGGTLGGP